MEHIGLSAKDLSVFTGIGRSQERVAGFRRQAGNGAHRSFRLREIDVPAKLEPDERSYSEL